MADKKRHEFFLDKSRLETLVDGVFAIVMTLLVMTIVVPHKQDVLNNGGFHKFMVEKLYSILNYILSFVLLAYFWALHHKHFHFIKRTDSLHVWINIAILLFLALIPFSTSLSHEFHEEPLAEFAFAFNVFIVAALFYVDWSYATRKHRLVEPDLAEDEIVYVKSRYRFFMAISCLAVFVSFIFPNVVTTNIFWVIPAVSIWRSFFNPADWFESLHSLYRRILWTIWSI